MTIFNLTEPVLAFPPVSPLVAASTSSLLTIAYVGNLYVSTATRIGKARSKEGVLLTKEDEPVVRSRLAVASWTSLVGLSATTALIQQRAFPKETPYLFKLLGSLRLVGISLPAPSFLHRHTLPLQPSFTLFSLHHVLPSILVPLALTSVLYAGPLLVSFFDKTLPAQQNSKSLKTWIKDHFGNVWGLRNYVVGPLTEEVVFRGCILGLHALAGASKTAQVFATPLYFGFGEIKGKSLLHQREANIDFLETHSSTHTPRLRELCRRRQDTLSSQVEPASLPLSIHLHNHVWMVRQLFILAHEFAPCTNCCPRLLQHDEHAGAGRGSRATSLATMGCV